MQAPRVRPEAPKGTTRPAKSSLRSHSTLFLPQPLEFAERLEVDLATGRANWRDAMVFSPAMDTDFRGHSVRRHTLVVRVRCSFSAATAASASSVPRECHCAQLEAAARRPAGQELPSGHACQSPLAGVALQRMLDNGVYASGSEIGDAENISKSYLGRILRVALLGPDVVEEILAGTTNQGMALEGLERPLPASWEEQRGCLLSARTS